MYKYILAAAVAYANTNAASKMYVCATAQNSELSQSDYAALVWTEITGIGNVGETGKNTNMLSYDTWDTVVTQKAKGITDAGGGDLELARIPNDAGQAILRIAGAVGNNNNYAFKMVRADGGVGSTGTIFYNRGLVSGPKRPNGRNEDFDLEVFTLAFQQEEIEVAPSAAGVAPYVTANPAITGTATVGQVLTLGNGTWAGDATITYSYAWFANNVRILGAAASTFTLTSAQLGKRITGRVTAANAVDSAYATTAPTAAVA